MPCTGISALSPLAKPIGLHRARHCDVHHSRLPARHGLGTWRSAVVPLLKHHDFRINNSLNAAGNSRPSRPCFVRPAQAESSDQELSELHEELLKQVVFNLANSSQSFSNRLVQIRHVGQCPRCHHGSFCADKRAQETSSASHEQVAEPRQGCSHSGELSNPLPFSC